MGYSNGSARSDEGTSYGLSSYLYRSGVSSSIWTRSRNTDTSSHAWYVLSSGMSYANCSGYSFGVLPVLRF